MTEHGPPKRPSQRSRSDPSAPREGRVGGGGVGSRAPDVERGPDSLTRGFSIPPPPPEPTFAEYHADRWKHFIEHLGEVAELTVRTTRSIFRRPFEIASTIQQMESLGVRSMGIVTVTSVFIGMVMTIQFAFGLKRFGGLEYIPRVVVLSFCRELAPTLTAIIVGGRIGSGMAAEVGAMNVTEQVDAIRALGADPAKKLVLPRMLAAIVVMPILSVYALMLGILGGILVCWFQFDVTPTFFVTSSLEVTRISDFFVGVLKTPVFGYIIAIVGCHFGLRTSGGTEGVGSSTTRTVVAVSITILIADFVLTKLFMFFQAS
ncbi:MAG: ABC transporter permease [Labilithrix sp.]|nr:ABC transporter permease [Labilithrix sp.]MCW5811095.1 ABC transporter permease [Labilithrix sp.]